MWRYNLFQVQLCHLTVNKNTARLNAVNSSEIMLIIFSECKMGLQRLMDLYPLYLSGIAISQEHLYMGWETYTCCPGAWLLSLGAGRCFTRNLSLNIKSRHWDWIFRSWEQCRLHLAYSDNINIYTREAMTAVVTLYSFTVLPRTEYYILNVKKPWVCVQYFIIIIFALITCRD